MNSAAEYLAFCKSLINYSELLIWRDEDLPLLQPYFNADNKPRDKMTDEEYNSLLHYLKCLDDYGRELMQMKEICESFGSHSLIENFGLFLDECEDDEDFNDEEYNFDKLTLIPGFNYEFPLVMVLAFDASFDRCGDTKMFFLEFVEGSMFNTEKVAALNN